MQEVEEEEEEDDENVDHGMDGTELVEVDENDMHNLNGTVLMLANDADGNQILIERNMADLENDESVHDMAQYVFQDGTGFALEDYQAIVASQVDEDDEEHQAYAMEIGHAQEEVEDQEHVQEEEEEEEEQNDIGEQVEEEVEEEEVIANEEEEEDEHSAKS